MKSRRLAIVFLALPIASYAYACSSSDEGGDNPGQEAGTNPGNDGGGGGTDAPTDSPSKTDSGDGGVDAAPTCIGNPLTADGGGTPDGGVNLDGGLVRQIVPNGGNTFNDGPQWFQNDAGAFLVYSDVFSQTIMRTGPDGGPIQLVRATGSASIYPIGNAVRGNVILTAVANDIGAPGVIYQTTINGDAGADLATGVSTNPNDLVVTANGTVLFTDPQYQLGNGPIEGVYRLAPDGGVSIVQNTNVFRPNGIALTADGKTLYVGQAPLAGDPTPTTNRKILKYAVAADGTVTAPGTTFIDAPALVDVPDGLAVDIGGNLWVAEAAADGSDAGRVEVFSPTGVKLGTIPFPTSRPTGITFGGTDGKGVYVTAEKGVFVYNSRCIGVK